MNPRIQDDTLGRGPRRSRLFKVLVTAGIVLFFVGLILSDNLIEFNDAQLVKVKQALDGSLTVRTNPGLFWQGLGKITIYEKSRIVWFSAETHEGEKRDQSIAVRYRDGGTAHISGSIRYILPYDRPDAEELILALHKGYRSERNFVDRAIFRLLIEAVQQTAGFFTSEESYTTHKATFSHYVRDQLKSGVYLVDQVVDTTHLVTGEVKTLPRNVIRQDADGNILRKPNPLATHGIEITHVVIYDPIYEQGIVDQIGQRLESKMKAIVAKSEASLRSQQRITAKASGERDVEVVRYQQLVVNVREEIDAFKDREVGTILAERDAEVAEIDRQASVWSGKAEVEKGRGQATAKTLLQEADLNLTVKIETIKEQHRLMAYALANGQPILPEIVLGGGAQGGAAETWLQILGIRAAQSMAKDMMNEPKP